MTVYPNGSTSRPNVSSPFGPRSGGAFDFHYGADFTGFDQVHATGAGRVTFAGWMNDNAGLTVIVNLGGGVETLDMHLDSIAVTRGEYVSEGNIIGVMGETGNAQGRNLHHEVRVNGTSVDPVAWLAQRVSGVVLGYNAIPDVRSTESIQEIVGADPDGSYGPDTTVKVKVKQQQLGVEPDGIWGWDTETAYAASTAPAPAPAPEPAPAPAAPAERTRTIVEGDTLWDIAEQEYGDGTRYQAIFDATQASGHPLRSGDASEIYPGEVITLP